MFCQVSKFQHHRAPFSSATSANGIMYFGNIENLAEEISFKSLFNFFSQFCYMYIHNAYAVDSHFSVFFLFWLCLVIIFSFIVFLKTVCLILIMQIFLMGKTAISLFGRSALEDTETFWV